MPASDPMDQRDDSPGADDPTVASEATVDSSTNPRKRKKSSRACDYCHINHQPCDNAKPRCGYCERHGKNCLYLRPQKKRGPAQGYRSALYSMRESAAAWGAVLHLVPTLAPVIEGYFKKEDGKRLIRAIKDPQQQEFYIQTWQQSSVFKTFFGDESPCDDVDQEASQPPAAASTSHAVVAEPLQPQAQLPPPSEMSQQQHQYQNQQHQHHQPSMQNPLPVPPHQATPHSIPPAVSPQTNRPMAAGTVNGSVGGTGRTDPGLHPMQVQFGMPPGPSQPSVPPPVLPPGPAAGPSSSSSSSSTLFPPLRQVSLSSLPYDPKRESSLHQNAHSGSSMQSHSHGGSIEGLGGSSVSLTDILARAVAQPSTNFSQALGSLGFAPEETLYDFVAMSYNPDLLDGNNDADPLLGSDLDQKAYYELLMGRRYS